MREHSDVYRKVRSIENFVFECLRPALYLWPWMVAAIIYAFFLSSDQGEVLSWEILAKPLPNITIAVVILLTGAVLFISCLLALIASIPSYTGARTAFRITVAGVWVIGVCSSFGLIFAVTTRSLTAWVTSACLVVLTSSLFIWAIKNANALDSSSRRLTGFLFRHRLLLAFAIAFVAIAPLMVGAIIVASDPMWITQFSPLLISMVGLSLTATLFGAGLIVIPLCVQLRWAGIVVFGGIFAWTVTRPLAVDEENPLFKVDRESDASKVQKVGAASSLETVDKTCQPTHDSLENALRSHFERINVGSNNNAFEHFDDKKLYLVSAEGGGIRAAYWTALILGQMDIAYNGNFRNRVASVSGVSGGSLGVATWLAAQERDDLLPEEKLALMKGFLQSDFLSPLLAGFLFLDVPRVLLGPLWFSTRRDHVFEKALADQWQKIGKTDFFSRPYLNLCLKGFAYRPAIFFNATDATSGNYVSLSSSTLPSSKTILKPEKLSLDNGLSRTSLKHAPVAQMVHISARFPFLSPEAEVGIDETQLAAEAATQEQSSQRTDPYLRNGSDPKEGATNAPGAVHGSTQEQISLHRRSIRVGVLVDGGYYDNSGLTPTKEALNQIAQWRKEEGEGVLRDIVRVPNADIEVLHIVNDPGKSCEPLPASMRDKLSPDAREFIQHTGLKLKCNQDRIKLEKSLRNDPMQWLMTPVQAALSVRERYSGTAEVRLQELINALELNVPIDEFSVASQFHDAYQRQQEEDPTSLRLATESLVEQRAARANKIVIFSKEAVERALQEQSVDKAAAAKFVNELDYWAIRVRKEGELMRCPETLEPLAPPLGWTLAKQNRDLLECLANRAAIKRDLWLPPPSFQKWIAQQHPADAMQSRD